MGNPRVLVVDGGIAGLATTRPLLQRGIEPDVVERAAPRLLGQASWRFLVDGVGESSAWTVRLGRDKAFLTIPVDGGRVYCYADVVARGVRDATPTPHRVRPDTDAPARPHTEPEPGRPQCGAPARRPADLPRQLQGTADPSVATKEEPMTTHIELDDREALAERLVDATTHALEALSVHLGLELGQALNDLGAATQAEVADHAGVAPRYAREWLEQQATAGYLACDNPSDVAEQRRYRLPTGHAEVLLDADSPYHAAPIADMLASVAKVLPQLLEAYRSGGGVPDAAYGTHMRRGIAALNRPMFLHQLASTWLAAVPDLDGRLRSAPPARVLDVGCGLGASSIALARAYPRVQVLGIDLDQASVTEARARAAEAGVADRVTFTVGDAAHVTAQARFELVTIFEALHDMGDPVGALRTARGLLAGDGSVLVADERVADAFTAPGDPTERFMYGWSVLHCLPATLAEHPVEASGTVLRAPTVARWAAAAGFGGFEVLPIDNPFWRFYRLHG
jgi:SAM-dependent methyltransferase